MSDLTFANPGSTDTVMNTNSQDSKSMNGLLGKILVGILVVAIVGEVSYFFYNRYISTGGNLPFKNLSTSGTMNYDSNGQPDASVETVIPATPFSNVSIGESSQTKANDIIETMFKYPSGFVTRGAISMSIEGKVVSVMDQEAVIGETVYPKAIKLVNEKGEPSGIRFSTYELERVRVIVVNKGVTEREAKFEDIKSGDFLNINISSDLMDLRPGSDDVTIEIRK